MICAILLVAEAPVISAMATHNPNNFLIAAYFGSCLLEKKYAGRFKKKSGFNKVLTVGWLVACG
jgi:hypothetical protein